MPLTIPDAGLGIAKIGATSLRGTSGLQRGTGVDVAAMVAPLLDAFFRGAAPVRFEFWDGSALGPEDGPGKVLVRSAEAIRHLVWAPGELGFGRAFVLGHIDAEGDLFTTLKRLRDAAPSYERIGPKTMASILAAARSLGALGLPPRPPSEEIRPHGVLHSRRRDARAISHHYDVGNDFHRLVLGPSMTYSCARFSSDEMSLEDAQASKHDVICRKLGLADRPGQRLLDVGCGWGSMAIHAALHYGAEVVGITTSANQAALARNRVGEAGLDHRVEIRLQDYRDVCDGPFDAISSVGMFEHVGRKRTGEYFVGLRAQLRPRGRLLNHAISSVGGSRIGRRTFMCRYVFPDSDLADVGEVVLAMERAGFEVRDVESLREHYDRTLRQWNANLMAEWKRAVAVAGEARARIWRLFTTACAISFADGGLGVHQVLGVATRADGLSGMPSTRAAWN